MNPFDRLYNFGGLFSLLFKVDPKDKVSMWLKRIGEVSFTVLFFSLILDKMSFKNDFIATAMGLGLLFGFLTFTVVAVRNHGQQRGITSGPQQARSFFGKVFLYVLLPSALITILIYLVAWATGTLEMHGS